MTEDELVREKVRRLWTNEREADRASEILSSFGTGMHEREIGRVRLAALKLSNGSLPELERLIRAARQDYRDLLAWAEYPEQFKAAWTAAMPLSPEQQNEMRMILKRDREQYEEWLKK